MGTIRAIDIIELKTQYNIHTFVETGTLYGDGVDYALDAGFAKILQGNSPDVLDELLPTINEPVLFWLDAHFPGCDAGLATYRDEIDLTKKVPLEKELTIISQRFHRDVIVCDDLWIYEDWQTRTGTFNQHCARHGHDVKREELCDEGALDRFVSLFQETHNVTKIYEHQGYLVFTPK